MARDRDHSDPEQVEELRQRERLEHEQDLGDLREILRLPAGRRFMWATMARCGMYRTSFTGNSTTFFNEGRRQIGLELTALLSEADPDAMLSIMAERRELEKKRSEDE